MRNGTAVSEYTGDSSRLIGNAAWPYYTALVLGLAGSAAAVLLHRRAPTWAAPAVLMSATVPAFALVTELWEPEEYYAPYADPARQAEQEAFAAAGPSVAEAYGNPEVQTEVGGWITFATLLLLAIGAAVWLGRSLDFLVNPAWAAGALVLIVAASAIGFSIAEAAADDTCDLRAVDDEVVSPDWAFFLVLYLPVVLAVVGVGAMTRRRLLSGALLVGGAVAAFVGMLVIGVEIAGPCLG